MQININAITEEQLTELLELIRSNHGETSRTLEGLRVSMANVTDVLSEVAAGLRGPLATSVLDLIRERDEAEAARVAAVNALAEEQGREATETEQESAAAQDLRDAFGEVAGLFDDPELPDVEPLPEPEPVEPTEEPTPDVPAEEPAAEEPVVDEPTEEPAPVTPDEQPSVDPGAEQPSVEPVPGDADEQPSAPADEPIDDGSGAIEPPADGGDASDVPASEDGAAETDVAPNPGAAAEEQS